MPLEDQAIGLGAQILDRDEADFDQYIDSKSLREWSGRLNVD